MNNKHKEILKSKKILVVEDTDSNFALINFLLTSAGARVDRAESGEAAIRMHAGDSKYDLIVMDIKLKEMDGYETTRKIRGIDRETPILANTAYAISGEREKSMEAGCTEFIAKPSDNNVLIEQCALMIQNK